MKKFLALILAAVTIVSGVKVSGFESYAADLGDEQPADISLRESSLMRPTAEYYEGELTEDQIYGSNEDSDLRMYAVSGDTAYWGQYSSHYYKGLLTDKQQKLYDSMYDACMKYLTTEMDIPAVNSGRNTYLPYFETGGMSKDDAMNTVFLFSCANPQFYFISGTSVSLSPAGSNNITKISSNIYKKYVGGKARAEATNTIKTKLDKWVKEISQNKTPLEKEKAIYNLVARELVYDDRAYSDDEILESHQSAATALLTGKSVCAGYSELFEMLAVASGLECIVVTSDRHEWNQVKLGSYWFNVDITWDDNGKTAGTKFFNLGDRNFLKGNAQHTPEALYKKIRPECPYDYGKQPKEPDPEPEPTPAPTPTPTPTPVVPSASYYYGGVDYGRAFDPTYYSNKYADLKAAFGTNSSRLFSHFINVGMHEGRQASEGFDPVSYAWRYPDLRAAFGSNLALYYRHYCSAGYKEGRIPTGATSMAGATSSLNGVSYATVYDYNYYVNRYSDLKKAFALSDLRAITHFVTSGMAEGRVASPNFDVRVYMNNYPDLKKAFGNNYRLYYNHYMTMGYREGRNAKAS